MTENLVDLDPKVLKAVLKQGGKKQVDSLLELFKKNAPMRVKELEAAPDLDEAQAAAKALGRSAKNLGLTALTAACDDIVALNKWSTGAPLAMVPGALLAKGIAALTKLRLTL